MPMSPTWVLFGIPPSAMTAQFSNSNGGILRSLLFGPRQIAHDEAFAVPPVVLIFAQFADIAQPLRHDAAGGRGNVDSNPLATEVLRSNKSGPATAEGIEHDVVLAVTKSR